MDVRSPFFQNIAAALAGIMFLNPIMVAAAEATLAAANGATQVGQAGNGVPVVNIATPNGNGLSHNQFNDYNVGQQGLILNNATGKTQSTQLGGIILGNANLNGQAAKLILNEVTGGSPSQLRGYTEVAGQQAHVVVANPNGITCNGCGFINTPRATLTTGKPIIEGGRLDRLQVDGGAISIEGQGLNATNVDQFDLITRSAKLNAELQANKLNIITGTNDVQVADLAVSQRTANPADEPQLAIDSSALGGMYAGAIRLVGTEAGVGVKLAGDMAASAGDIQIDANGQLSLAQTAASGSVRIAAEDVAFNGKVYAGNEIAVQAEKSLTNQQSLAAHHRVALSADKLENRGIVESGVDPDGSRNTRGDLSVTARVLENRDGTIAASHLLQIAASETIDNQGGTLSAGSQAKVSSASLDNRGGRVLTQGELTVTTDALNNSGEGLVYGQQRVAVQAGTLDNRTGQISTTGQAEVAATSLDNRQGSLVSEGFVTVEAQSLDNRGGLVSGWQGLELKGGTLDNSASGTLSSKIGTLAVELQGELNNSGQGALVSKGDLKVQAASLDNNAGGVISSQAKLDLELNGKLGNQAGLVSSQDDLQINATEVDNRSGEIGSSGNLLLHGYSLDNGAGKLIAEGGFTLELLGLLNNANGQLASTGNLLLSSGSLDNRGGQLVSQGLLELLTGGLENSAGGTLAARDQLQITAGGQLNNGQDGLIYSEGSDVEIAAAGLDNSAGSITSKGQLSLTVDGALNNRQGILQSADGNVDVTATSLDNRDEGLLASLNGWLRLQLSALFDNRNGTAQGESLEIVSGDLRNDGGHLSATLGDASINANAVENGSGGLFAKSLLTVTADSFGNQGNGTADEQRGKVAAQRIDFSLSGALNNRYGLIESGSTLTIEAASLNNSQGKLRAIGSASESLIDVGLLDNRSGLVEVGNSVLRLQLDDLKNADGQLLHTGIGSLALSSAQATSAGGTLFTSGELNISAQSWTNSGILQAARLLLNVNQFNQTASGQLLAGESLTATGGSWINNGVIASDGDLSLILSGAYSGSGKLTSLGDLTIETASLSLGSAGRISGGLTEINIDGTLANSGKITSATDLLVETATLDNYGTLGSGENLRLSASNVRNERGLIFSGEDMALQVDRFTNWYGDVFSLGSLVVAKDAANRWATLLDNVSGTIESRDDMQLRAVTLRNRKEKFELSERLVSGDITYECKEHGGHCAGSHYDIMYYVDEVLERLVESDSPSANLVSGADLLIRGGSFTNSHSLVSATGDISITVDSFSNEGAAASRVERHRMYRTPVDSESGDRFWDMVEVGGALYEYAKYNSRNLYEYWEYRKADKGTTQYKATNQRNEQNTGQLNPNYDPSRQQPVPSRILGYTLASSTETVTPTGTASNAVVQAGGALQINATDSFNNSVLTSNASVGQGSSKVIDTAASGTGKNFSVVLNAQLPPDLQQKQINPLTLPGFSIPQGDNGLFRLSGAQGGQNEAVGGAVVASTGGRQPGVHRYLIETNPELTNLKSFLGSDYLLGHLGYDLDDVQQRLGDGLYEQRLIREAIVARTGQRYLAGLTSDEAMFRYLMDNAIASKSTLNLSLGVSLTAEQVAALTHDIVWLEEHEVLGQKVLVPVLYLAQAEGRLAANGALLQGRDVSLISGGDLSNQGTLRASQHLSALASGNLGNGGLIEAGERLQLLAGDSIRNAQGGIIAGRDVGLTALSGDVINERSVTRYEVEFGRLHNIKDFADSSARVEAAGDLNISAGRDVANLGGVLESRGDLTLNAGRDVTISSVEERALQANGKKYRDEHINQLGATVSAGGDVEIGAGRDLAVIASRVKAEGDVALSAGNDVLIASAADEDHFYSKSKKVTRQKDHVDQQSSEVLAGGDVVISASNDLLLSASKVRANDEAYLVAGGNLALLSAEDYDYSLYQKKSKGSFGRKSFKRDEVTHVTNVGSEVSAGSDVTLLSGGDQLYQRARLESGGDLTLDSGGEITFEAVKDLHQESHEKSSSSLAWTSAKGKGKTDETLLQTQMIAQGDVVIRAVDGLNIDVKQVNQQTVGQTIDAMVAADPSLAWIKAAEVRGDVDWRRVKEIHDSFKYSHSGLGAGAQLVIAIVIAYLTAGAASGLAASGASAAGASTAAGSAWAAGAGASLSGIGWANAAATAVMTGAASNATISTINNRGNLGAVLKDVTSEDALRGYVVSGATAGLTSGYFNEWTSTQTSTGNAIQDSVKVLSEGGLSSWSGIGSFAGNQLLQNGTSTVLDRALGGDSNFGDALRSSLANTFAAAGFNWIGDLSSSGNMNLENGSLTKIGLHAVMGGLAAEAAGGDFKTGALAAGVNEAVVGALAQQYGQMDPEKKKSLLVMNSQLIGVLAAAAQGEEGEGLQTGAWVAGTATQYNHLEHRDAQSFAEDMESCGTDSQCQRDKWQKEKYAEESIYNDSFVQGISGAPLAKDKMGQIAAGLDVLLAINCSTAICESYKADLVGSALVNYAQLSEVLGEWSPSLDRIALLSLGAGASEAGGLRPRPAGTPVSVGATQVEKALDYFSGVRGAGAKGILTPKDFPEISTKISQKQLRHIAGTQQLEARGGGGFLSSVSDAQKVLDAYHAGQVKVLGKNAQGFPVVKFEGVTGTNVNLGVGITDQATNVFIIKGTKSPSIVPTNPNWSQK